MYQRHNTYITFDMRSANIHTQYIAEMLNIVFSWSTAGCLQYIVSSSKALVRVLMSFLASNELQQTPAARYMCTLTRAFEVLTLYACNQLCTTNPILISPCTNLQSSCLQIGVRAGILAAWRLCFFPGTHFEALCTSCCGTVPAVSTQP